MIQDNYQDPTWAWMYQAKCAGTVTGEEDDYFFPPRDKAEYKAIADKAKAMCNGLDGNPVCPVRVRCLKYAIDTNEEHGILGGMSHRERNALKRRYESAGMTLDEWIESGRKTYKKAKRPAKGVS